MTVHQRLFISSGLGLILGGTLVGGLWLAAGPPVPTSGATKIIVPEVDTTEPAPIDLDQQAVLAMAELLATPLEHTYENTTVLSPSEWIALQVHALDSISDQAKIPFAVSAFKQMVAHETLAEPAQDLIEYTFYKWGQTDPEAAKALEAEILNLPCQYWFPFNGIYAGWAEHAPFVALESLLDRFQWSYAMDGKQYGISKVFEACFAADPEAFLERMEFQPARLQVFVTDILQAWQKEDPTAFLAWVQKHPLHPATHSRNSSPSSNRMRQERAH